MRNLLFTFLCCLFLASCSEDACELGNFSTVTINNESGLDMLVTLPDRYFSETSILLAPGESSDVRANVNWTDASGIKIDGFQVPIEYLVSGGEIQEEPVRVEGTCQKITVDLK